MVRLFFIKVFVKILFYDVFKKILLSLNTKYTVALSYSWRKKIPSYCTEGQKISEGNFGVFNSPKNQQFFLLISACPSIL